MAFATLPPLIIITDDDNDDDDDAVDEDGDSANKSGLMDEEPLDVFLGGQPPPASSILRNWCFIVLIEN